MDTLRACGCKGRRSCLWCEKVHNIAPDFHVTKEMREKSYVFCPQCNSAWPGWNIDIVSKHPHHDGEALPYPGILVLENFLSTEEANALLLGIDAENWDISQSGRRKQNYGPKCNFKKRKIVKGSFNGFPQFSTFVHKHLRSVPLLNDFYVIEQCSLEYDPSKGASIDPHIDDCWIWGERVVTVNVLGDSVLTMLPYKGGNNRYNLDLIFDNSFKEQLDDVVVRIPMPARSLIVMFGEPRYQWEHCVLREDITSRRVCLAYREFTPPYLPDGDKAEIGKEILAISKLSSNLI